MNKLWKKVLMVILLGVCLSFAVGFQQTKDPGVLLRAAIEREEVDGDLNGAIDIYQEIIEKFSSNKGIAAQAQLRIGLCYEKLGEKSIKQALEAFQKVLDNFPGQTEAVQLARQKLSTIVQADSGIQKSESGLNIYKIEADPMVDDLAAVSPDGRTISFVDWETGDLAVYDIEKKEKRRLTNKGPWTESEESALISRWSPDGKKIVYVWFAEESRDLRIIDMNNPAPRILLSVPYDDEEGLKGVGCQDWSPDGTQILALANKGGIKQIVSISVKDGSYRTLKEFAGSLPTDVLNMRYSPDGQHIVCDFLSQAGAPEHDILLMSADGKNETKLVEHPADDVFLGFLADGKNILFSSNRNGTWDLWATAIQEGKSRGLPILVKSNLGNIAPLGVTQSGSFCYVHLRSFFDIYGAEVDLEKGKLLESPKKMIRYYEGTNNWPDYSPDGQRIAYISRRNIRDSRRTSRAVGTVLCLYSVKNGEIEEVSTKLNVNGPPTWSPDGSSILLTGSDNGNWGLFILDVQTGEFLTVVSNDSVQNSYEWAADGNSVYYVLGNRKEKFCEIFVKNLQSGSEKKLYERKGTAGFSISLSPDGLWLAVLDNSGQKEWELKALPVSGGEPKTIYSFEQLTGHNITPIWSADGQLVVFANNHRPVDDSNEEKAENAFWPWAFYGTSIKGGETHQIDLGVHLILHQSFHPDGRQIVFGSFGPISELTELRARVSGIWIVENILSGIQIQK